MRPVLFAVLPLVALLGAPSPASAEADPLLTFLPRDLQGFRVVDVSRANQDPALIQQILSSQPGLSAVARAAGPGIWSSVELAVSGSTPTGAEVTVLRFRDGTSVSLESLMAQRGCSRVIRLDERHLVMGDPELVDRVIDVVRVGAASVVQNDALMVRLIGVDTEAVTWGATIATAAPTKELASGP